MNNYKNIFHNYSSFNNKKLYKNSIIKYKIKTYNYIYIKNIYIYKN